MKLEAKVNFDRFEEALQVVDAHTAGEFCRMVIGGFPEPEGSTMIEKKKWMEEKYDHVRTALMLEPRGHHDMFGAFLCEPIHEEADLGVIFMDTGGYLNMCGHCTIGAVTVALEAGLVECHEGENHVVLDAPAGIIRTTANVENGKVTGVTLTNVPAFIYKDNLTVNIDGVDIPYTISFGGSFFALVDTTKLDIGEINAQTVPAYTELGMKMRDKINAEVKIQHPKQAGLPPGLFLVLQHRYDQHRQILCNAPADPQGVFHPFHGIPDDLICRITAIVHTHSPPYRFRSSSLRCFPDVSCASSCSFALLNRSSISFDWTSICWLKRIFFRSSFNSLLIS